MDVEEHLPTSGRKKLVTNPEIQTWSGFYFRFNWVENDIVNVSIIKRNILRNLES